uniref:E3 ubiquitin-protein ligase n=1 Tax=Romanomermis culicivorax TaxID=13658 RepID=A0A915HFZ4_ROMCU
MALFKSKQKNAFDKHVQLETMLISSKPAGFGNNPDTAVDSNKKSKSEFDDILKLAETEYEQDSHKSVQCVICGAPAVPTSEYPLALIISAQATSILGKCYDSEAQNPDDQSSSDSHQSFERLLENFSRRKTKSVLDAEFKERCSATYSESVFYQNTNNIWNSGVLVQTCGHYVHVDCHENYVATLRSDSQLARYSILQIERGEFNCPLCRRFCNAVLPIVPKVVKEKFAAECDFIDPIRRVLSTLEVQDEDDLVSNSKLKQVENDFIASMKACSYPQFMTFNDDYRTNDCSFLCDLARANLEIVILLMQEGQAPPRLCISELLNLIVDGFGHSLTAPLLVQMKKDWSTIKGLDAQSLVDIENVKTLALSGRPPPQMPLMSRDLTAIYLRYVFCLGVKNCTLDQFHALTDIFCALISLQVCLNFVRDLNIGERKRYLPKRPLSLTDIVERGGLSYLVSYLIQSIEKVNDIDQIPLIDMECVDNFKTVSRKDQDHSSTAGAVNMDTDSLENRKSRSIDSPERRKSKNMGLYERRKSDAVDIEMTADSESTTAEHEPIPVGPGSIHEEMQEDDKSSAMLSLREDSATKISAGSSNDDITDDEIFYEIESKLRSRLTPYLRLAALLKIYGDFSAILSPTTDESVQISNRKLSDKLLYGTTVTNLDDLKEFTTSNRRWLNFGDDKSPTSSSKISRCLRSWLNDAKFFEKTGDCLL